MGASEQETYKNPKAPINIISGAAVNIIYYMKMKLITNISLNI